MKKIISFITTFLIIVSSFGLSTFAQEVKKITVSDEKGNVVYTVEIDLNKQYFDHYVRKATKYIRDLKPTSQYTVKIPNGTYIIDKNIEVYSNTIVDFGGSKMIKSSNNVMLKLGIIPGYNSENPSEGIFYNGYDCVKNITVMNGTFDGYNTRFSTVKGEDEPSIVKFSHAENITLKNITLQNTKGVHHQLAFAACKNVKITDCSFLDMNTDDISNNCEAVQIDILNDDYFVNAKNYDGTPTKDVLVENCTFKNVHRGIGTHSAIAGHYFENINFKNNKFENVDGYAIRTANYRNSEISGNVMNNCGCGILVSNMTNRDYSNFLAPLKSTDKIYPKSNIIIQNNKMNLVDYNYYTTAFGIDVLGAYVKSNTDKFGKKYSGDFRVSDVEIKNNTIVSSVSKNNFTGINLEGVYGSANSVDSDFVVKNNTIQINAKKSSKNIYGITVNGGSKLSINNNTIFDNVANNALKNGIYLSNGNTSTITENKIYNIKNSGLRISGSDYVFATSNNISNTYGQGIYIGSSSKSATIQYNTISNVADDGIALYNASAVSISSNTIKSARANGIELSGNAKSLITSNNEISNVSKNGIFITDSVNAEYVSKNSIRSSNKSSIYVSKKATVSQMYSNNISSSKSYGIIITSSSKTGKIKYNTINKSKKSGIYLSSKALVDNIQSNNITNSAEYAIYLTKKSTARVVSSNSITNPGKNAINLDKTACVININKNNIDIKKSKVSGISISQSASAKKINENIINFKKSKNGKKLKVNCNNGIIVNSSLSKTKQIISNKIKNCKASGIAVLSTKLKVSVSKNTISGCKFGIKYIPNKTTNVTNNKIKKASTKKLKTVVEKVTTKKA